MSGPGDVALVCRWGSATVHAIALDNAPPAVIGQFVRPFVGLTTPAVVACGAVLNDARGVVVVMQPTVPVRCIVCRRWLAPRLARGYVLFDPRRVTDAIEAAPLDVAPVLDDLLPRSADRRDRPSGT